MEAMTQIPEVPRGEGMRRLAHGRFEETIDLERAVGLAFSMSFER